MMKQLLVFVLLFIHLSTTQASNSAGELELSDDSKNDSTALLLSTDISGSINGLVANIRLKQLFKNNSNNWVNGRYVFPLPEEAAIDSMQINVGERIINGVIKEKTKAKKIFDNAKKSGKKASLLEQHRPNIFSISIANIAPFEEVAVNITFIEKVNYKDETFSLRLPTTLTPRYIPGRPITKNNTDREHSDNDITNNEIKTISINSQTGWAVNTDLVSNANDITPPQTHFQPGQTTNLFSLRMNLNAGLSLASINSNSHTIVSHFVDNLRAEISLANGSEPMDSDLILEWKTNIGHAPQAALFQQTLINDKASEYYSMLMVMPPASNISQPLPRDVTFIIDSSGSMAGSSMRNAKQSLHQAMNFLSLADRFNIIDFDSNFRSLFSNSKTANQLNINDAHTMIDNLFADGGTEMFGALEFALQQQSDEHYLRQIIFITDGSIGNEDQLFDLIKQQLGSSRLFTIGIGHAPNTYFMRKAAKYGRGTYTYINQSNQVGEKMQELFLKLNQAVLRNIKVDWLANGQPIKVEQFPQRLPDLYAGEPITLIVKSDQPLNESSLSGQLQGQNWQQTVKAGVTKIDEINQLKNLDSIWARDKVESLMDSLVLDSENEAGIKLQVTELGIAHGLLTKFTSFVAVEQKPIKPENIKSRNRNVTSLMPRGSTMIAPQTATPATLYSLLGVLLLSLSLGVFTLNAKAKEACYDY